MSNTSIRFKLLILFAISVFTAGAILAAGILSSYELMDVGVQEAQQLMLEGQKGKIKVATSSMAEALSKAVQDVDDEQEKINIFREMIRDVYFEEDSSGYYFIYEGTTNIAHPVKPALHGKDLGDLKGKDGVYSVRELAKAAAKGDFVRFMWDKPGSAHPVPKLGYATMIPGTSFWIGTGVYIDNIEQESQKIAQTMLEKSNRTILIESIIAAVLLLLLLLPLSMIISRGIVSSIKETTEAADTIAAGDFDLDLKTDGDNEISRLKKALSRMAAALKENLQDLHNKEQEAVNKAREAQQAMDEAREANALSEQMTAELLKAANQLATVVETVNSGTSDLFRQIDKSSSGAAEQSERVGETATAMEQMTATVIEVARNASTTADAVDNARKKAEEGAAEVVRSAESGIVVLNEHSSALKKDMAQLGDQVEAIGRIMDVITDIADQTNLLALNAAIEAARAGDAGRGFAVVADEVRKLAEKTMAATSDVGNTIQSIQEGTRKNIDNVEMSVSTIEKVSESANESGMALREIVELVTAAAEQVHSIATAADQQSATTEQISRSIDDINTISTETATAMRESHAVVEKLASQVRTLTELIGKMKAQG